MFACMRELSGPGVSEHCVRAKFTRLDKWQLVVGRGNGLEVYDVLEVEPHLSSTDSEGSALALVAKFTLFGKIESITVVEKSQDSAMFSGSNVNDKEASSFSLLLLTFGEGRASLVEYDPSLGPSLLKTRALFNFETNSLGSNLRADTPGHFRVHGYGDRAVAEVDPLQRCAAMHVNGFQIAVIPLNNDEEEDEEEEMKTRLAKAVRRVAMDAENVWEMPSGCFLIDLPKIGIPVSSVQHMTFLHDQNGLPVLAVLHQGTLRTNTGRLVAVRWTAQLTAITVSRQDVSVVWKVRRLPHDSLQVVACEDGSALVLSQNAIHHVVGGSVKRTLELNGFSRNTSDVELLPRDRAPTEVTLDGVKCVWIGPRLLLMSLRFGQLVVLELTPEALTVPFRVLANQCSSMCLIDENHLFLASRLADSTLMRYKIFFEERKKKKAKYEDQEDEELYGETDEFYKGDNLSFKALQLEVVDTLATVGPIGGLTVSENVSDGVEMQRAKAVALKMQQEGKHSAAAAMLKGVAEREKKRRKPKEIVCTSGRGLDGGVRIVFPGLRFDARNDLLGDLELDKPSQSIFAINLRDNAAESLVLATLWGSGSFSGYHCLGDNYQLEPRGLTESETACFEETQAPTLLIDSWLNFIVQVTWKEVILFERKLEPKKTLRREMDLRAAFLCQEHLMVLTRDRALRIYHVKTLKSLKEVGFGCVTGEAAIVAGCLYNYGRLMCALVRGGLTESDAGAFEVYDVAKKKLIFRSNTALALGHRVIEHRGASQPVEPNQGLLAKLKLSGICISHVGKVESNPLSNCSQVPPVLCLAVALQNGDLIVYSVEGKWERLCRVEHDVVTRLDRNIFNRVRKQREQEKAAEDDDEEEEEEEDDVEDEDVVMDDEPKRKQADETRVKTNVGRILPGEEGNAGLKAGQKVVRSSQRLVAFDYMDGFCGIMMVSGQGTSTCVLGSRGSVSVVRIDTDAYHIWNMCVNRSRIFLLATNKKLTRVLSMDSPPRLMVFKGFKWLKHMRFDGGGRLPLVEVPLQVSVIKVEYQPASRTHILVCAEDDPSEEKDLAVRASCSIRLLCNDTLQILHQYTLQRYENGLCTTNVTINIAQGNAPQKNMQDFCGVGTGFIGPEGEDAGCRGRLLLFRVENQKIKLWTKIESRHIRGPICSLGSVDGLLVASFGSTPCSIRTYYYDPTQEALVARSFIDTAFAAISMKTLRNYVITGDLYHSIEFTQWHSQNREFRILAKDIEPLQTYAVEHVQLERQLGFVVSDNNGNLHLKQFVNTKFLAQRAEMQIGSPVNHMVNLPVAIDHTLALFGTLDGAIGCILPCSEPTYRRLNALQAAMSSSALVPRNAGLNPRAFRMAEYDAPIQRQRARNFADGLLLYMFPNLDQLAQRQLARLIGTTPETIIQDLLELDEKVFTLAL